MTMYATPREALWPLLRDRALLRIRGMRFRARDSASLSPIALARIDALWSAATGLSQIDLVTAAAFQAQNLLLSLRAGEPSRAARALSLEAISCALEGTHRRRRVATLLATARDIATSIQEPHAAGIVALADGIAAMSSGQWDEGDAHLAEAEATFRYEVRWRHLGTGDPTSLSCLDVRLPRGVSTDDVVRARRIERSPRAKRSLHSCDDRDVRRADRAAVSR